jgi:two-component system cell cycle sensor histidine kinase/response regulator CckA
MKTLDEVGHPPANRAGKGSCIVLVVDDEAAVRRFATRVLEREGFGVIEAVDGAEALEILRDKRAAVDAVVSDIVMPRMNGVELLDALSISNPGLPVLLMSGYATAALSEMGIASPCGILPKPFPPERLLAELERCLAPRNDGSSAA